MTQPLAWAAMTRFLRSALAVALLAGPLAACSDNKSAESTTTVAATTETTSPSETTSPTETTLAPTTLAAPSSEAKDEQVAGDKGLELHVVARGGGAPNQRTVILIPGGPGLSSDYLKPLQDKLASKSVRVVRYDPRATGRSSVVDDGTRYGAAIQASDIDLVRRWAGAEKVDLIGHSTGGTIAYVYTGLRPENVRSLTTIGALPLDESLDKRSFTEFFEPRRADLTDQGFIPKDAPPIDGRDCTKVFEALFPVQVADPSTAKELFDRSMTTTSCNATASAATSRGLVGMGEYAPELANFTGPVRLFQGDKDPLGGTMFIDAAAKMFTGTTAERIVVPNAGTYPWLEVPTVIDDIATILTR